MQNNNRRNMLNFYEVIKPTKRTEYNEIRVIPVPVPVPVPVSYHETETGTSCENYYQAFSLRESKLLKYNITIRSANQFFVKTYEQYYNLINIMSSVWLRTCKVCYGINCRSVSKHGELSGKKENVKTLRFVYFDIDNIRLVNKSILKMFVENKLIPYLRKYRLTNPSLIDSGGGFHLLYRVKPTLATEGKLRWLKKFVKLVSEEMSNNVVKIDTIADSTRIFGLPGSVNLKRNCLVKTEYIDNTINDEFKFHSIRSNNITNRVKIFSHDKNENKILSNDITKLLLSTRLPSGNRNRTIIFQLKLLLKSEGFTEHDIFVRELFRKIGIVQGEQFPCNIPTSDEMQYDERIASKILQRYKNRKV
jgi:hypothetical protein